MTCGNLINGSLKDLSPSLLVVLHQLASEVVVKSSDIERHLEVFSNIVLTLLPGVLLIIISSDGIWHSVRFAAHKPPEGFNISCEIVVHRFSCFLCQILKVHADISVGVLWVKGLEETGSDSFPVVLEGS